MNDLLLNYATALKLMVKAENGEGETFLNYLVARHNRRDGSCDGPCCK